MSINFLSEKFVVKFQTRNHANVCSFQEKNVSSYEEMFSHFKLPMEILSYFIKWFYFLILTF